jgi:hypothetical protein
MHPNQYCGAHDNNICGAINAIRETIANSELTNTPTYILRPDFKDAFENIAHTNLFSIMEAYGFSTTFRDKVQRMYTNATSSVQINGHISNPIPIKCSVLQGCPLSMILFTICINPFICMLEEMLKSTRREKRNPDPAIITYADDVTVILRM